MGNKSETPFRQIPGMARGGNLRDRRIQPEPAACPEPSPPEHSHLHNSRSNCYRRLLWFIDHRAGTVKVFNQEETGAVYSANREVRGWQEAALLPPCRSIALCGLLTRCCNSRSRRRCCRAGCTAPSRCSSPIWSGRFWSFPFCFPSICGELTRNIFTRFGLPTRSAWLWGSRSFTKFSSTCSVPTTR